MGEIKRIGILGIGGVGSLLASRLSLSKHKLFCLGSEESNLHFQKNGIQMRSSLYGNSEIFPDLIDKAKQLDFLFLTVKGPNLISSLNGYKQLLNKKTILISLLNGMDYRDLIKNNFDLKLIIGSVGSLEVFLNENRVAIHKSKLMPKIELASSDLTLKKEIPFIKNLLEEVSISAEIKDDENSVIWRKLSRLAVISTITSMYDVSIGFARNNDSTKKIMLELIDEIYLITSTLKLRIERNELLDSINSLPYNLMTSMQRDINSNKASEIEYILKAPLELGKKFGLRLPMMTFCYQFLINKIEKGEKYDSE